MSRHQPPMTHGRLPRPIIISISTDAGARARRPDAPPRLAARVGGDGRGRAARLPAALRGRSALTPVAQSAARHTSHPRWTVDSLRNPNPPVRRVTHTLLAVPHNNSDRLPSQSSKAPPLLSSSPPPSTTRTTRTHRETYCPPPSSPGRSRASTRSLSFLLDDTRARALAAAARPADRARVVRARGALARAAAAARDPSRGAPRCVVLLFSFSHAGSSGGCVCHGGSVQPV